MFIKIDHNPNLRTPLPSTAASTRRVGIPHLPTGKTPLLNSTMKNQHKQLQTSKRNNLDATSASIITPIKQRRFMDTIENTSTNSFGLGNLTAAYKSSIIVRNSTIDLRLHLFCLDNTFE